MVGTCLDYVPLHVLAGESASSEGEVKDASVCHMWPVECTLAYCVLKKEVVVLYPFDESYSSRRGVYAL